MSCGCGHHHSQQEHASNVSGIPISLKRPLIGLNGKLICAGTADLLIALALLPEHVKLSRAEPGCLRFDIWLTDNPMVWQLAELFVDEDSFAAHQARTQASEWGQKSTDIKRDFQKREIAPVIREQKSTDVDKILHLIKDKPLLAHEVRGLLERGILSRTLVAEAESILLGYAGLQDSEIIGPFVSERLNAPEIADALRQEVMRSLN